MSEHMGYMRLNEAFQFVDDKFLDIVEQEKRKKKKKPVWAIAGMVAASICILVLPVAVIAARWFGLRDLLLPQVDNEFISFTLSQYQESVEVLALNEWKEFLDNYDTDGQILSEVGEGGFSAEGRDDWLLYGIYTNEMGEVLDRIADKYGLRLHTAMNVISHEELETLVSESLIGEVGEGNCYIYENGAFYFENEVELNGYGKVEFQFSYIVKGTLDEAVLMIDQTADYAEWQYTTSCGESVLLVLGASDSMILANRDDSFIAISTVNGSDSGITEVLLQELADIIDFTVLKDALVSEMSGNSVSEDVTYISFSGYMSGSDAQALAEWNEFLANYDTDHQILDQIGNGPYNDESREDWSLYGIYTHEMEENLDEIVKKYGLKLHTEINVIDPDELMYRVGGRFIDCDFLTWAYIYEDGYFHVEGDVELEGCGTIGFQFTRLVKGTFNDVVLNIGQVDEYTDWQYTTSYGEPVLLAMGPDMALIFADFDECFIAVNVMLGSENGGTKENLQELADRIDFRILKDVKVPDMRGDSEVPAEE